MSYPGSLPQKLTEVAETHPDLTQSLIDAHENPFVLIDDQYQIVAANRAYRRAYGLDEHDGVVGRRCFEVSHHLDRPCHLNGEDCPHRQVFATGETHEVLHTHYDARGQAEHVRIRGHAIRGGGDQLWLGESIERLVAPEGNGCDGRMIGFSPPYLRMLQQLGQSAASQASILLQGESGVGKELAARFIHHRSLRADGPLVTVDCTTLNMNLFEAELFGHEKGAFTGSVGRRPGLFEQADKGTLFLDEVGELPLELQAKLLRVLENGEFRRVGGRHQLHADVRVVAATNRDLLRQVEEGGFREDLYYRLACIVVFLPSLRERREDIPALADALLNQLCREHGRPCYMTREAVECLTEHDFPGNIRELKNLLQRAVALSPDGVIDAEILDLGQRRGGRLQPMVHSGRVPAVSVQQAEKQVIADLLQRYQGHRRRVAEALGVSERTLYRKLQRFGLG